MFTSLDFGSLVHIIVCSVCTSVVPMIDHDHRLVSSNDLEALDYDIELSILLVEAMYKKFASTKINNHWHKCQNVDHRKHRHKANVDLFPWSDDWYQSIVPSCMCGNSQNDVPPMSRLGNRSSIASAIPMIGCENRADSQHYYARYVVREAKNVGQ